MGQDAASEAGKCPQCSAQLALEASFCPQCGCHLGTQIEKNPPPATISTAPAPPLAPAPASEAPPKPKKPSIAASQRMPESNQASADPLIGATVADRYVIESMIGRGGMGVVYKVEHAKIGKVMALKLLTGSLSRNQDTVRRFKREAMMVSKLSHPNTVQVFDYGSVGGLTYLAMEYLNGQDLGELVDRQGPRPFGQMAKIVIQACGALQEAHDKGMVHRDIKPENLFLTRTPFGEELVKVLDFGLAKLRENKDFGAITRTGNIVGTPYYMPPEQVRGEDVDPRGDVYALCALLYTCLTGVFVFDAPNPVAVLSKQLAELPVPPHERAPEQGIPSSVSDIVLKGLEKDPGDRFQSAAELAEALRGELSSESLTSLSLPESGVFAQEEQEAVTRSEVERYEQRLKKRAFAAKGVTSLLGLGALGLGFHLYQVSQSEPAFNGWEREPNHDVSDALAVPFGEEVRGHLGKRITPERGDQDNFLFEVPKGDQARTSVRLELTGLRNMATCVWVFSKGRPEPLAQYCTGGVARDIIIPDLSLKGGKYLFVVKQDVNSYGSENAPLIHENISDEYILKVGPKDKSPSLEETEPNDKTTQLTSAKSPQTQLSLSGDSPQSEISGSLSTTRDVDTVCASGTGKARLVVHDAEGGNRPLQAALKVTPLGGPHDKIPVRIHGGRDGFEVTERDQGSPWKGPTTDLSENPCVRLTLVPNPWAPHPHPAVAPPSEHKWRVSLESIAENSEGEQETVAE